MFICDQSLKDELEAWAESEGRTVSNLMERVAQEALAKYKNTVKQMQNNAERSNAARIQNNIDD